MYITGDIYLYQYEKTKVVPTEKTLQERINRVEIWDHEKLLFTVLTSRNRKNDK